VITCNRCGTTDQSLFTRKTHRERCTPCWAAIRRSVPNWREIQQGKDRQPRNRFSQLKAVCKKQGIAITLTLEQYEVLLSKPCHYCGGALSPYGRAIDKWNPLKGYTPDNVVPCCGLCNDVRGAIFTPDEMKLLGAVVAGIQVARAARGFPRADRVFTHYSAGRQRGIPSEL
jgi:hypothetical protein